MQRLGRGARDPSVTAVGIYLVEPLYFDTYTGKRKRPAVEASKRPNKRAKTLQNDIGPGPEHRGDKDEPLHSEFEEDEDERDGSESETEVVAGLNDGSEGQLGGSHERATAILPLQPTALLPDDLDNNALERYAMYAFINARHRGFCRRRVSNEYFDNPKG